MSNGAGENGLAKLFDDASHGAGETRNAPIIGMIIPSRSIGHFVDASDNTRFRVVLDSCPYLGILATTQSQ